MEGRFFPPPSIFALALVLSGEILYTARDKYN
jgi:hypothetical protein